MNCGNSTNLLPRSRVGCSDIRLHSRLSTVERAFLFMHKNLKDMTGLRFGRLVVLNYAGSVKVPNGTKTFWNCICDCGTTTRVGAWSLRKGSTQSCGCFARDSVAEQFRTHGHAAGRSHGHPVSLTYKSWCKMVERCTNPNTPNFHLYGGRGIRVCDSWRKFENFLADMGERPSKHYSIDRYPNNDGHYEPGNCRWATRKEQSRNTRVNKLLTFGGRTMCLSDWAQEVRLKRATLKERLERGWSLDKALFTPLLKSRHERDFSIH